LQTSSPENSQFLNGPYGYLYNQEYLTSGLQPQQFSQFVVAQQQQQPSGYYVASGSEAPGYAYGTYRGVQQQQQQQPSNSDGPQPQYAYPPQYVQHQGYRPSQAAYYRPYGNGQQSFQSEESSNQVAFQNPESQQQQPQLQQESPRQPMSTVADQDGISYVAQSPQQQQQFSYQNSGYDQMTASASNVQPQEAQASVYRPTVYYRPRPYRSSPATLDVHQVVDDFIRSTGLSPQGDHENVPGDYAYAESKPVFSLKKLYSYPFYFSSSGDKATSYGNSIR